MSIKNILLTEIKRLIRKKSRQTAIDNKIINLWPEKVAPKSEKVSRKKLKSEKVFIV